MEQALGFGRHTFCLRNSPNHRLKITAGSPSPVPA
jgi:hypothetical protein